MLDLRIMAQGAAVPLFDLPSVLGRQGAYQEIGDQIDTLIAFMDALAGDPDLEDEHDAEDDRENDAAWTERLDQRRLSQGFDGFEDAEEDDDAGQCDEDGINTGFDFIRYTVGADGPGCAISDSDSGSWQEFGEGACVTLHPYDDGQDEEDGAAIRRRHRNRIRRTRCETDRYGRYSLTRQE